MSQYRVGQNLYHRASGRRFVVTPAPAKEPGSWYLQSTIEELRMHESRISELFCEKQPNFPLPCGTPHPFVPSEDPDATPDATGRTKSIGS